MQGPIRPEVQNFRTLAATQTGYSLSITAVHNEKQLLHQASRGNQQAFAELFRAYHQPLGAYLFRITESAEATEDIVQDVFIKLWTGREALAGIGNFSHYLFIVSRNRTYNYLREKASRHVRQLEWARQFEAEEPAGEEHSPLNRYRELIEEAVGRLPPQQQTVYILSRHKKMKHEEIAARLGISAETSKKHMKLALRAITEYVRGHADAIVVFILLFSQKYF